jgi:hypothetical protein
MTPAAALLRQLQLARREAVLPPRPFSLGAVADAQRDGPPAIVRSWCSNAPQEVSDREALAAVIGSAATISSPWSFLRFRLGARLYGE